MSGIGRSVKDKIRNSDPVDTLIFQRRISNAQGELISILRNETIENFLRLEERIEELEKRLEEALE